MAIILFLIDKNYGLWKNVGLVETRDVMALSEFASKNELHVLASIDVVGDTILNQQQLVEFKKELMSLKKELVFVAESRPILNCAIDKAMTDDSFYLMFKGE